MPLIPTIQVSDYKPGFYWGRLKNHKKWSLIIQIIDPSDRYYDIRSYRIIWIEMESVSHGKVWRTDLILGPEILSHQSEQFDLIDD